MGEDLYRTCRGCTQEKAENEFRAGFSRGKQYTVNTCLLCERESKRAYSYKKKYGITIEEYESILASQNGACAICQRKPRKRILNVDHNHKTGKVRGLLCLFCNNKILGGAHDKVEILERAVDYLRNPPAEKILGQILPGHSNNSVNQEQLF